MSEKTTLYQDANSLCNKIDSMMIDITSTMKESPCIISEDKSDVFTKMYKMNEAFKLIADARSLLRSIK